MNPRPPATRFPIVDDNPKTSELDVRSFRRKFPHAIVLEAADVGQTAESMVIDAIVLHSAFDADALSLVQQLRAKVSTAPIIMVSGVDRSEKVLAAGAARYRNSDQWLVLGLVVANAVRTQSAA